MAIRKELVLVPLALIVLVSGLAESFQFEESELASEQDLWNLYDRWSKHHAISRNLKQMNKRFFLFKENANYVFKVNQMNKPYKLRLNKFGDMSNYEFVNLYARSNISHYRMLHGRRREDGGGEQATTDLPSSTDWRDKGAVNDIKMQYRCGSCWAFSAVAAVESLHQIKTKQLVSLSEQEVVDCDRRNGGCRGGFMGTAFEFIQENGGISTEVNYPYHASQGYCLSSQMNSAKVRIDGYKNVPANEDALMQAVANQPVSVGIAAEGPDLQFYWEGVFDGYCGRWLNHGVVVIGYGRSEDGIDYWIVRNSWGLEWGEEGYVRIRRGVQQPQGQCGIAMEASYPI